MFESAEIGHKLKKSEYKREEPRLREQLLAAQYQLLAHPSFPVLILVNGVDGAGKGETVNLFNEWMDPRHIHTHAFGPALEHERERPAMWRFWQALPPRGKIGIMFGSWYTDPILERVMGHAKRAEFEASLERVRHFERMLAAEGALLLKFWFHLSKSAQIKRLKSLSADRHSRWRVTSEDWRHFEHYDEFVKISARALRETSTGEAPWHVIEGSDPEYRSLTAGRLLLDALTARLAGPLPVLTPSAPPPAPAIDGRDVLNTLDYRLSLSETVYAKKLEKLQGRLNQLTRKPRMRKHSLIIVFEGMDAAGKGSTIRRVTRALDARYYRVIPIAAPTDEERAQPYLWRFWRHIPLRAYTTIFDRSWYGRVLVERVEQLCTEADWLRSYHEINEFEEQLSESGVVLLKFWLATTPEEQLRRFKEREEVAHKRFKITPDDWRNRKQWPRYERAVADMIERTSTDVAPWHVIPANDKRHARVEVLSRICETLARAFKH